MAARSASGSTLRAGSEAVTRMPATPPISTRAQAHTRARTDIAQPLVFLRRRRKQLGKPCEVGAKRLVACENPLRERGDARRVQRNRARRICPEHTAPIRREEPRRDRAHRVRREACVAGEFEDVRSRHGHFFGFACALQQRKQTLNRALLLPRPRAIHRDRRIALTGNLTSPRAFASEAFRAMMTERLR